MTRVPKYIIINPQKEVVWGGAGFIHYSTKEAAQRELNNQIEINAGVNPGYIVEEVYVTADEQTTKRGRKDFDDF